VKYDRTDDDRLVSFIEDSVSYDLVKFRRTNQPRRPPAPSARRPCVIKKL
jgi:hypothetical protein